MHFLCLTFLKIGKLEMLFSEARFLCLDERKKQTWQPLITQTGRFVKKIVLKREEAWLKLGGFT